MVRRFGDRPKAVGAEGRERQYPSGDRSADRTRARESDEAFARTSAAGSAARRGAYSDRVLQSRNRSAALDQGGDRRTITATVRVAWVRPRRRNDHERQRRSGTQATSRATAPEDRRARIKEGYCQTPDPREITDH